jgi:hypothetical protein
MAMLGKKQVLRVRKNITHWLCETVLSTITAKLQICYHARLRQYSDGQLGSPFGVV